MGLGLGPRADGGPEGRAPVRRGRAVGRLWPGATLGTSLGGGTLPVSELAERVQLGDRDRYDAARFADQPLRDELIALYAFNLEAARLPWISAEPQIGAIRLRWLLDRIADAYADVTPETSLGEAVDPFLQIIRTRPPALRPPREAVDALVSARVRDLDPSPIGPDAAEELDGFLDATGGSVMRLAAHLCLGGETPVSRAAAEDAGYANGAARLLEATAALAARGRLMTPCPAAEVAKALGGEMTPGLRAGAVALAERALTRLARARALRAQLPGAVLPALLAGWRTARILSRARRRETDLFRDLGPDSEFRRRLSLLGSGALGRW